MDTTCCTVLLSGDAAAFLVIDPMATMLVCWCLIRVSYITLAVRFVPELTTVSWAYPITWTCSSIIFLIYFLKADWMHAFDKAKKPA